MFSLSIVGSWYSWGRVIWKSAKSFRWSDQHSSGKVLSSFGNSGYDIVFCDLPKCHQNAKVDHKVYSICELLPSNYYDENMHSNKRAKKLTRLLSDVRCSGKFGLKANIWWYPLSHDVQCPRCFCWPTDWFIKHRLCVVDTDASEFLNFGQPARNFWGAFYVYPQEQAYSRFDVIFNDKLAYFPLRALWKPVCGQFFQQVFLSSSPTVFHQILEMRLI